MTTRVLGVRAADVLSQPQGGDAGETTTRCSGWACCARVWGLQMYQRAVRGPIEGPAVVRFLLDHDRFPRAVRALLREMRLALAELPDPGGPLDAVDHVEAVLRDSTAASTDGTALDAAMDELQVAIALLDKRITGPVPAGRARDHGDVRRRLRSTAQRGRRGRGGRCSAQFLADHLALDAPPGARPTG